MNIDFVEFNKLITSASLLFAEYYKYIDKLGFSGKSPYKAERVKEIIKEYKQLKLEFTPKENFKDLIEECFDIYYKTEIIRSNLLLIKSVFEANQIDSYNIGSSSSSSDLTITASHVKESSDIKNSVDSAIYDCDLSLDNLQLEINLSYLITSFIEKTISESETFKTILIPYIELITTIYKNYTEKSVGSVVGKLYSGIIIAIYGFILNKRESSVIVSYIDQLLENLKDNVLENNEYKFLREHMNKENRSKCSIQKMIQVYSLTPESEPKELHEVLSELGLSADKFIATKNLKSSTSDYLKKVSKAHNVGFVVIIKLVKMPVIHVIKKLIDEKFIEENKLWQPTTRGVNETAFKRGQTIMEQKLSENIDAQNPSVEDDVFIISDGNDRGYVLESIDGRLFRFLHPWGLNSSEKSISLASFEKITSIDATPSSRLEKYNTIINTEITSHIAPPLTENMKNVSDITMSDSQIQNIIQTITASALEIYRKKLEKKKDFAVYKILELLYDDEILSSVVNLFGEMTLADIQRRDTTKSMLFKSKIFSQYDEELAMTYLVELISLKKVILKKMRDAYSEKSRIYGRELNFNKSDNEYEKINKVINVYKLVLSEGLKYLINRRENIVLALRDKMTLMEFTLFQIYKKGF